MRYVEARQNLPSILVPSLRQQHALLAVPFVLFGHGHSTAVHPLTILDAVHAESVFFVVDDALVVNLQYNKLVLCCYLTLRKINDHEAIRKV